MKSLLKISALKLKREQEILREIHWEIRPGENWAILGPNGCGKTTLLHALTGYEPPSSGEIQVLGRTYGKDNWRQMRKRMGIVGPWVATHLEGRETGLGVVASGREAMVNYWGPLPEELKQEAKKILWDLNCSHLAGRPWKVLSQGERQRLLIGRALMARYEILLLDEACAGLDLVAREKFLKFLADLIDQAHAPALIFVTHHVEEIFHNITHVLLMKSGKVFAAGPKAQVLTGENLSEVYEAPISVQQEGPSYRAELKEYDG